MNGCGSIAAVETGFQILQLAFQVENPRLQQPGLGIVRGTSGEVRQQKQAQNETSLPPQAELAPKHAALTHQADEEILVAFSRGSY